jgi:hypothetical protein
MCEKPAPNEFEDLNPEDIQPANGLHLQIFGGYGMFTDTFFDDERWEHLRNIRLCHECSVKLIEMFPVEFQARLEAGHPSETDEPCCKFSWKATELFGEYVKNDEGRLVPSPGVHFLVSWPDNKWVPGEYENP